MSQKQDKWEDFFSSSSICEYSSNTSRLTNTISIPICKLWNLQTIHIPICTEAGFANLFLFLFAGI